MDSVTQQNATGALAQESATAAAALEDQSEQLRSGRGGIPVERSGIAGGSPKNVKTPVLLPVSGRREYQLTRTGETF